jgi:ArsR family transcriptional regulator, arsenate/arsenite/antimonite-responsive transcriptional repressor
MDEQQVVRIAKALSDKTRFRILQAIISDGEICGGKLADRFQIRQATVSHHLKILLISGLININRKGQFNYARATFNMLSDYHHSLDSVLGILKNNEE